MLLAFDLDPDTGKAVPVSRDQMMDETSGFTTPPEGLSRVQRRAWQSVFRAKRKAGQAQEVAWYKATKAACRG